MAKFPITIKELTDMMQVQLKPQEQQDYLNKHGQFEGLAKKLKTNLTTGKKFRVRKGLTVPWITKLIFVHSNQI
jgi:hypothetical protein